MLYFLPPKCLGAPPDGLEIPGCEPPLIIPPGLEGAETLPPLMAPLLTLGATEGLCLIVVPVLELISPTLGLTPPLTLPGPGRFPLTWSIWLPGLLWIFP